LNARQGRWKEAMKLTLTELIALVRSSDEDRRLVDLMLKSQSTRPAALVALQQIYLLFSEDSSNTANINRITTNLEAIADDILSVSKNIKRLGQA
jgi:hypothetical protein